jgi:hypothetical protein
MMERVTRPGSDPTDAGERIFSFPGLLRLCNRAARDAPGHIAAWLRYFTGLVSAAGLRLIGRMLPAGSGGKRGGFAGGVSPRARKPRTPVTRTCDPCMRMFPNSSNSPQRPKCASKGCFSVSPTAMWSSQASEMAPLARGPVRPAAA